MDRSQRWRTAALWQGALRGTRGVARSARRAVREPGRERDLAAQAAKGAGAALLAWLIATLLLTDSLSLMAPWVAVVLVQATVYQSLSQGVRLAFAIVLGTVLATGTALVLDSQLLALALVLPVTLLIGNLRRLGSQGVYVATSAIFALAGGPLALSVSVERVLAALIGAVVGIAVNSLIRPPRYLRDALQAIRTLTGEAAAALRQMAEGLAAEPPERRTREWVDRTDRLPSLAEQVRSALDWDAESLRLNIRARRSGTALPSDYTSHDVVRVLSHVTDHIRQIAAALDEAVRAAQADGDEETGQPPVRPVLTAPFNDDYVAFLGDVAEAVAAYGDFVTSSGSSEQDRFEDAVRRAAAAHRRLRRRVSRQPTRDADTVQVLGPLLADAGRLIRQLER